MEVKNIDINLIHPSPMNPRKTFDPVALQELADNIEEQGLIQPITIRPLAHLEGHFEIVCGERRYRASAMLRDKWQDIESVAPDNRFQTIPSIIREMSDDEAYFAMITENLQRKDVDPIEEAFAFARLMEMGKSAEEISQYFGKSVRFVQDRVRLNSLIPELQTAVKEGRMSISAALIISRLKEKDQQDYCKRYAKDGYDKGSAVSFAANLFMTIQGSVWHKMGDRDYEGGCMRRCSECLKNTATHGCLFHEMNDREDGKCTDRERFTSKSFNFLAEYLGKISDQLVRKGEPLKEGKMVVLEIEDNKYDTEMLKELKKQTRLLLEDLGIEMVNPYDKFTGKCWHPSDDARRAEVLKSGEGYRAFKIFHYDSISLEEEIWYLKRAEKVVDENGTPREVISIVQDLKRERENLTRNVDREMMAAMAKNIPTGEELADVEKLALAVLLADYNREVRDAFGIKYDAPVKELYGAMTGDGYFVKAVRAWIGGRFNEAFYKTLQPILNGLSKAWMPSKADKIREEATERINKNIADMVKTLADLGYDEEGNKLQELPKDVPPVDQYRTMKERHPDTLLLFRVGDFYELFDQDAEDGANILGITLTRRGGKDGIRLAGFPHHAIDDYLPRLIRSGRRVAICDEKK